MFQENSIETCTVSRVKQITSPGWMHETSARTWCTGKTQRERVEREVGGGIRMGNTYKPMAVSFQCMTKFTTNKKKLKKKIIVLPRIALFGRWMLLNFSQALCLFDICLSHNFEVYWAVGAWLQFLALLIIETIVFIFWLNWMSRI